MPCFLYLKFSNVLHVNLEGLEQLRLLVFLIKPRIKLVQIVTEFKSKYRLVIFDKSVSLKSIVKLDTVAVRRRQVQKFELSV